MFHNDNDIMRFMYLLKYVKLFLYIYNYHYLHLCLIIIYRFSVTKIFKELQFPCRLAGSNYSKDVIFKPKKRNIKLLIQYYPNSEDYDEDKFSM